jgi:hypothetical protein
LIQIDRNARAARHSHHPRQRNVSFCTPPETRGCVSPGAFSPRIISSSIPVLFVETHAQAVSIRAKMNGATGNFSAHAAAAPLVDWPALSRAVIEGAVLIRVAAV